MSVPFLTLMVANITATTLLGGKTESRETTIKENILPVSVGGLPSRDICRQRGTCLQNLGKMISVD